MGIKRRAMMPNDFEERIDSEGRVKPLHCECWGCGKSAHYHSLAHGVVVVEKDTEMVALCRGCSGTTRRGKVHVQGEPFTVVTEWREEEE